MAKVKIDRNIRNMIIAMLTLSISMLYILSFVILFNEGFSARFFRTLIAFVPLCCLNIFFILKT